MKRISYFIFLLFIIVSCNVKKDDPQALLQSFTIKEVTPEQFYQILYFNDTTNFILIDLRNPHQYAIGHLPHAINISSKNILDKKHKKILKSNAVKLFYSDDPGLTRLTVTIVKRAGYQNCYAVLGTYKSLRDNFVKKFAIKSAFYDDEKPDFNYKEKFAQLSAGGGASSQTQTAPKPQIQVPVKKKQVGGGCE